VRPGSSTVDQVRRVERASRTPAPSRILSSHCGQTRGLSTPFGVNTRAYAFVTKAPQFWHSGILRATAAGIITMSWYENTYQCVYGVFRAAPGKYR
jgi:hypothetical protein